MLPNPRTMSLMACREELKDLEVPCPPAGTGAEGRCTTCDGTGVVYPLRQSCPCDIGFSAADDYKCARCFGVNFLPAEPRLETLLWAAAQAGYTLTLTADSDGGGFAAFVSRSDGAFEEIRLAEAGTRYPFTEEQVLLTAYRAVVLATRARKTADGW